VYVDEPAGQRAVAGLGLSGTAVAPQTGDYLMPVGVNTGAKHIALLPAVRLRASSAPPPDGRPADSMAAWP
jgi:hypothetical protein